MRGGKATICFSIFFSKFKPIKTLFLYTFLYHQSEVHMFKDNLSKLSNISLSEKKNQCSLPPPPVFHSFSRPLLVSPQARAPSAPLVSPLIIAFEIGSLLSRKWFTIMNLNYLKDISGGVSSTKIDFDLKNQF